MTNSPLRLESSLLEGVHLRVCAGSPASGEVEVKVDTDYGRAETDRMKWLVRITVDFGSEEQKAETAYSGQIKFAGLFVVNDADLVEEKHLKLVAVNCPSILYSAARETIATLTARSVHGILMLPSVSFIDQMITTPQTPRTSIERVRRNKREIKPRIGAT